MLDLLSDFLDDHTTIEEKQQLHFADRVLQRAQLDYEHVIEEILMTTDDMDAQQPMTELLNVYHRCLDNLFDLHAVGVVPDLTVYTKAQIVDGLLNIDNDENIQHLLATCNEDTRPLERLAILISSVTTLHVDPLLQLLDHVDDAFFSRLKDAVHAEVFDGGDDDAELQLVRDRLHAYHKFDIYLASVGASLHYVPNLLRTTVKPGMLYEFYARMIDGQQPLLSQHPLQIAREMFACALISSDGFGNPGETVKASLEAFIPDLTLVSNVMVEVRQLMIGYAK